MSKKSKSLIAIIAAIIAVLSVMILISPKNNYSATLQSVVQVANGEATLSPACTSIQVAKDGTYVIAANWGWEEDPGFITAFTVTDEAGNVVFEVTGDAVTCDSIPMELQKGEYLCSFEAICSTESYFSYTEDHFEDSETGDLDESIFQDGIWNMNYSVEIGQYTAYAYPMGLLCGLIIGFLLVAFVITASRKENAPVRKYDERQLIEQGKSCKYGFITMIAYYLLLMLLLEIGVQIPAEITLLIFVGFLFGATVEITYSIWKDAYFRADESKIFMIGLFTFLTVLNLCIGAINIANGRIFVENTMIFSSSANPVCGIFTLYILILLLIKYRRDKQED